MPQNLTNQLTKQHPSHLHEATISGRWLDAAETDCCAIEMQPGWDSLFLHRTLHLERDELELRLDVDGCAVGTALVGRSGRFLSGPTGPEWAKALIREIAEEWRSHLAA